jgi:heme-degrading monooxygenase HmoA
MIALQIYMEPVAGKEKELEKKFNQVFIPAISVQKGFVRVSMLKSREALRKYQVELVFESEELRLEWVASKEHQEAFPQIAALCQRVSWSGFDITGEKAGV